MNRHPVLAALLFAVVALQLGLGGSGVACAMPAGGSNPATAKLSTTSGDAMMGMPMPDASGSGERTPGQRQRDGAPCDQSLPTAACHGMAACTTAFLAMPAIGRDETTRLTVRIAIAAAVMAPSISTAPELPPPRA